MTFKEFQLSYIDAYKNKKPAEIPNKLFEDQQELYDTFMEQVKIGNDALKNKELSWRDRLDIVLLIDSCSAKCLTIVGNYKEVAQVAIQYNKTLEQKA